MINQTQLRAMIVFAAIVLAVLLFREWQNQPAEREPLPEYQEVEALP